MTLRYVEFRLGFCCGGRSASDLTLSHSPIRYTLTHFFLCRERDTTDQLIGSIDDVLAVVTELVQGTIDWPAACQRLPAYDGVQAVD